MAFGDFLSNNYLYDSGSYINSSPSIVPSNHFDAGFVGNQDDLRFIMQAVHNDSSLLVGGTDVIDRSTWGYQGAGVAADEYVHWLMGCPQDSSGNNLDPTGYNTVDGGWTKTQGKQHVIIVVYSNDDIYDTTGGVGTYVSDVNTRFKFWLQQLYSVDAFSSSTNAEFFIEEVGNAANVAARKASTGLSAGWYSSMINAGTGHPGTYDNVRKLFDYNIPFVPLFDPNNLNQLNPVLDNYEWEHTLSGAITHTFSLATDRFSLSGASDMVDALWSNIDSADARFNNITGNQDERRRRIFITQDPVDIGKTEITNKMIRPHVDGTNGHTEGWVDYGFKSGFADLKAAIADYKIYNSDLTGAYGITGYGGCNQGCNLIISDQSGGGWINNVNQHVGNLDPRPQLGGAPVNSSAAFSASNYDINTLTNYLGGGALAASATSLISGLTLDAKYKPIDAGSAGINICSMPNRFGYMGGVRIWENAKMNTCIPKVSFENLSHQNYPGYNYSWPTWSNTYIGTQSGTTYGLNRWHGDAWVTGQLPEVHLTTEDSGNNAVWNAVSCQWEDNSITGQNTSPYISNAIYTGYSESTWAGLKTTCNDNEQHGIPLYVGFTGIGYQAANVIGTHQIISFTDLRYIEDPSFTSGTIWGTHTTGLYYNLSSTCDGMGVPTLTVTNGTSCAGAVAINGVIELSNLTPLNLENASLTWTHPAGQNANMPTYSGGGSNHYGCAIVRFGTNNVPFNIIPSLSGLCTNSAGKVEGLIPGLHTVKIVDSITGCITTLQATITSSSAGTNPVLSAVTTQEDCGTANGTITLTVTGGTGPYSYSWIKSGGGYSATTKDIIGLSAGTYQVTVTDANGCVTTGTYIVSQSTNSITTVYTKSNLSCYGANDGAISITNLTGTWSYPLTIHLRDGGVNGAILQTFSYTSAITFPINFGTTFSTGQYTIEVIDGNGCTDIDTFSISQPPAISFSTVVTPTSNCATTNNVYFSATGGQMPYTFYCKLSSSTVWNTAANPLVVAVPGTYDFKVIDYNGCSATDMGVVITAPLGVQLTHVQSVNMTCYGQDNGYTVWQLKDLNTGSYISNTTWTLQAFLNGSTTVAGTSTTQFGVYQWKVEGLGHQHLDLVGTVNGTVCVDSILNHIMAGPCEIILTEVHSDESCSPGGDGSIDISMTNNCTGNTSPGGTPPYTWSWTKDGVTIAATTQNLSNLTLGTYVVTVTDGKYAASGNHAGCTASLTIIILGNDAVEDTTVCCEVGPQCTTGLGIGGSFAITNTVGDFPFEVWFSTTSSTTGFLQIESPTAGNSGSTLIFDSVDLASLVVFDQDANGASWTFVIGGANISLPANQTFWIYLLSATNSCLGPTVGGTIPPSGYVTPVITGVVTDAGCCTPCGGSINITVTGGAVGNNPFTYVWTTPGWVPACATCNYPFATATTQNISNLCGGDYQVEVQDICGFVTTANFTVASTPIKIDDIQYSHSYCDDCHCGTISIFGSGGTGGPYVYTINNGLHWVDTDPGSLANGPTIFNISNYNASTITPGTWVPGIPGGFENLDAGIYRIWFRDNACSSNNFADGVFDCHSTGGPPTCINFCIDCSANGCYADFVDFFADHSVSPWNGGTKVELEDLSTIKVITTSHSGVSTMGGSNGSFKFTVEEDYFWTGMTWYFELFIIDPSASTLPWDSNLSSATYGDVCCDIPGNSPCSIDCCNDITYSFDSAATTGQGGWEGVTSGCLGNISVWSPQLIEVSTGIEICPALDGSNDSLGYYIYSPNLGQIGTPVEFEFKNLSITAPLGATALEAMYTVRVTNNVSQAPPTSFSGVSGAPLVPSPLDCADCAAAVLDNGMYNFMSIYGAEHCDCNCPPGYSLDENQYVEDPPGSGTFIINPNYNTCVGFGTIPAHNKSGCFNVAPWALNTNYILAPPYVQHISDPLDCVNQGYVWMPNLIAATISQNMPCCFNALTWGLQGAKLYGDWSGGGFSSPVPIGQDIALLPYMTSSSPPSPGENSVRDSSGALLTTHASWQNLAPVFTNRLKDIGIWAQWFIQYTNSIQHHRPLHDLLGITVCTEDLPQATNFILALAGDDHIRFSVDGNVYIDLVSNPATGTTPQHNMWNLFPISLNAGKSTLFFEGESWGGPAAFAFELYPFEVGGTPTVAYLANPGITALDIQNIVVSDFAGNPISSEHYIGLDLHSTDMGPYSLNPFMGQVGIQCPPNSYLTYCGGVFKCVTTDEADPDCPKCLEDIEDIVGCVGNLSTAVHNKIITGLLDKVDIHDNIITIWRVLLIRYLIKRYGEGLRGACITPEVLVSWAKFLLDICPDCESNVKTIDEVDYLPDPNASTSPISGINLSNTINNFDF